MSARNEASVPRSGRTRRKNLLIVGTFLTLAIFVAAMFSHRFIGVDLHWLALMAAAASLAFSFAWLVALDEVALRAHMEAWLWGGLGGFAVFGFLLIVSLLTLATTNVLENLFEDWWGRSTVAIAFLAGVAATLVLPALGLIAWWAAFWLRKR